MVSEVINGSRIPFSSGTVAMARRVIDIDGAAMAYSLGKFKIHPECAAQAGHKHQRRPIAHHPGMGGQIVHLCIQMCAFHGQ